MSSNGKWFSKREKRQEWEEAAPHYLGRDRAGGAGGWRYGVKAALSPAAPLIFQDCVCGAR